MADISWQRSCAMAKSSDRSFFLVRICIATVCFFGSCKAQSGYDAHNVTIFNIGDPWLNDAISANPKIDMNTRSGFGASENEETKIGGDEHQLTNGDRLFDNAAYRQNPNNRRDPNYYDPLDMVYDGDRRNVRNPFSDDSLLVNGERSAFTYETPDSYDTPSQQMDCGNYNTQYERDLCERDVNDRWASTIYGINSYRSTDGYSTRGSQSGLSQSTDAGESYSNRMSSPNQAYRWSSYGRNRNRQGQPAFGGQSQSSSTGLYQVDTSLTPDSSRPYYAGTPRSNYRASSNFNGGNLHGSSLSKNTGSRQGNGAGLSRSYKTAPPRPIPTVSSKYSASDSSRVKSKGSSQARRNGSNDRDLRISTQPTDRNRSQSSQTESRRGNVARPSGSYQTVSSQPIHPASSQGSEAVSSRLKYNGSSQVRHDGSSGGNLRSSSQLTDRNRPQSSQTEPRQGNEAIPSNSYQAGPSRPIHAAPSQISDTNSFQLKYNSSSQTSSKGSDGRNLGRASLPSSRVAYQYRDMGSNGGKAARRTDPRPTHAAGSPRPNHTGSFPPYYTDLFQPDYKGPSQYTYTDSSQSDVPAMRPNSLYRPSQVSGHIPDQEVYSRTQNPFIEQTAYGQNSFPNTNFGSTNSDGDRPLLAFHTQLKIVYGQFSEIINCLLRYFDQASNRLTAQFPMENQPEVFVPVIDDGTSSLQLNGSPSSALEQFYRRAKHVIHVCIEYLKRSGVHLRPGVEYKESTALESLLSSLYQTGRLIIQEIGSNTKWAHHPFSVQYRAETIAKLRNFMINLRNVSNLVDRYIKKVNIALRLSYSGENIDPRF